MSNEHCEHCDELFRRMFFDFDGETYAQVRVGKTLGYPAQLAVYTSDECITFGINYCPRCGRDLKAAANVKPRTVENVLEEFADSYYRNVRNRAEPDAELVRKCAAEIRELLGVEG